MNLTPLPAKQIDIQKSLLRRARRINFAQIVIVFLGIASVAVIVGSTSRFVTAKEPRLQILKAYLTHQPPGQPEDRFSTSVKAAYFVVRYSLEGSKIQGQLTW